MFGQQNTQGGLFGAPAATGGTSNLFGQPAASTATTLGGTSQPTGNLFGASTTNTSGGLFGAPTTTTQSSGLFGAPAAPAQPATTAGGLFGASQPTGGLFGATSTTTPTTQTATSTGLFGSTTPSPAPTTGGLFGASTNTPSAGGLFGSSTTTPAASTGGLFGATSTAPKPASGLFGAAATTPSTGGGLFGTTPSLGAPSGGLFGSTATTGGGLFGTSTTTTTPGLLGSGLGTAGGLFGTGTTPTDATGALNVAGGILGAPAMKNDNWQHSVVKQQVVELIGKLESISRTLGQELTAYTYEMEVNPTLLRQKQSTFPADIHFDRAKWEQARDNNPFPDSCYPQRVNGLEDLLKRMEEQKTTSTRCAHELSNLSQELAKMSIQAEGTTLKKLLDCQQRHVKMKSRLVRIISAAESLAVSMSLAIRDPHAQRVLDDAFFQLQEGVRQQGQYLVRVAAIRNAIRGLQSNDDHKASAANNENPLVDMDSILRVADVQSEEIERLHDAYRDASQAIDRLERKADA